MANSSPETGPRKPRRRRRADDFPLFHHKGSGYWCKKLDNRHLYFGRVADDPEGKAALEKWLDQKDDLLAGREPRDGNDELRLKYLCDHFLTYKSELVESGELTQRTLDQYTATLQTLVDILGKFRSVADIGPEDFAKVRTVLAKRYKPVSLTNKIQTVRSLFKYAYDAGLLDRPARFGLFKKPRAKVIRETRLTKGDQDFTAAEVRSLLNVATVNLKAMILLGVQAGFGNTDVAELDESAVELDAGWIDWPRAKTATHRRVPLWPESVRAIRAAMETRPEGSPLVFIGRRCTDYIGDRNGYRVAREFDRAVRDAGIRKRGFYCLRRSFQTQAEDSRDLVAVKAIMGHIPSENDMSARYRQRVSDERLRAVVEHVHRWLWPRPTTGRAGNE